jgi:GTPase
MTKICLIGRTNVGKSTLFNRLIQKRKALVSSLPHLTRDRNYEKCVWKNKSFMLIDTGGVATNEKDFTRDWIVKNVAIALQEAELVVLVVDGKEGLNPLDKEILNWIRKYSKEIIIAVNKIDSSKREENIGEFYKLGIDKMYSVSALHGYGVDNLLDAMIKYVKNEKEEINPTDINVAIVGKPNVGKSSIINKILNEERVLVSEIPGTTRDSIDTYITINNKKFCLVDTAGLRKKHRLEHEFDRISLDATESSIERSDISVLVMDAKTNIAEQDLRIANLINQYGRACVIAINKWDLIDNKEEYVKKLKDNIKDLFPFLLYAPILFVSAKSGQRIEKLFPLIEEVYSQYTKKLDDTEVNNTFREIYNKKLPSRTKYGKTVIVKGARQSQIKPPAFYVKMNTGGYLDRNYVKYVERKLREKYGFLGTPIRIVWDILKKGETN